MDHERRKRGPREGGVTLAKIILMKRGASLVPTDDESANALAKIKDGKQVLAEVTQPRNIEFLRKYWALVGLVFANLPERLEPIFPTQNRLHEEIKYKAGVFTTHRMADGQLAVRIGSIALHKMKQDEFDKFFSKVCDIVAKYFLHGITSKELRDEVERMIGMRT